MARIRTIKPQFWTDEKIGQLSWGARLLFIACWNLADDEGILIWNSSYLRGQVFPYEKRLSLAQVMRMMNELTSLGMCICYTSGANNYAFIPAFAKHQTINRGQPSDKPLPTSPKFKAKFTENSLNSHGTITDDSVTEKEGNGIRKGMEGNGREEEGKETQEKPQQQPAEQVINKPVEKTKQENVFSAYEENIGMLTPIISERLKDAEGEYGGQWVLDAMSEAVRYEKRNMAYIERILQSWKQEGKHGAIKFKNQGVPGQKPAGAFSDLD
jgi:DnaD/phage-associated family protein